MKEGHDGVARLMPVTRVGKRKRDIAGVIVWMRGGIWRFFAPLENVEDGKVPARGDHGSERKERG